MAVFKCKMCGGPLEVSNNELVVTCEYCDTTQSLPKNSDDVIANLFNRANNLRIKSEFDKAAEVYEKIISKDNTESEAYWGLVLCKYGVEYVEDPKTEKRIPTCHRTQYESILTDVDFRATIENSDSGRREIYQKQAEEISVLQKDILEIVKNEKPFDVFICYKETDENGKRTVDSVLANDIYYQLTQEGLKVFYAAITLEDKLGQEYEPYIFAALNSAKVMLVVGTKPEYFESVWVKNEWSRYLKLMKTDRSKLLVPCYRDMDAYDLPEEFSHIQAQDMSKIGFVNDVVRNIKKVAAEPEKEVQVKETVVSTTSDANIAPLLKRAFMFLEDGDFKSADEYCEKVLDIDPECAEAYLGKLLADIKITKRENIKNAQYPFDKNNNYQKAFRFGDEDLKTELKNCIVFIEDRNEKARLEGIYNSGMKEIETANKAGVDYVAAKEAYQRAAEFFSSITQYENSSALADDCLIKADAAEKNGILSQAKSLSRSKNVADQEDAIKLLKPIHSWENAEELIKTCNENIKNIQEEKERKRKKLIEEEKKQTRILIILISSIAAFIFILVFIFSVIVPAAKYNKAEKLFEEGKYSAAIGILQQYTKEKHKEKIKECYYYMALDLEEDGETAAAAMKFALAEDYEDADEKCSALWDKIAFRETLVAGDDRIIAVKNNGTVSGVGDDGYNDDMLSFYGWNDIISVVSENYHNVGLKKDGTVVATGSNYDGKCDVEEWEDIVAIAAGDEHTVGLKKDGTVIATVYTGDEDNYNNQCSVGSWTDIMAIAAGETYTIGLKTDGTVVTTVTDEYDDLYDVTEWEDIVAISANDSYAVGLKSDGTVVTTEPYSYNSYTNLRDVTEWTDIIAISAGVYHTVGLKKDGTVVATGFPSYSYINDGGRSDVDDWKGIVAISAGGNSVGLKKDGTVVATGSNSYNQCDVDDWKDIKLP